VRWAGQDDVDLAGWTAAWRKALEGVAGRAARPSPETRPWSTRLIPAIEALERASDLGDGLRAAAEGAEEGDAGDDRRSSPAKGRASYLGERSKDHQDPGATSTYYHLQDRRRGVCRLKGDSNG